MIGLGFGSQKTIPRIQTFAWLVIHKGIATKVFLHQKGLVPHDCCNICLSSKEVILHLLAY